MSADPKCDPKGALAMYDIVQQVVDERLRQINKEGYSRQHDDAHDNGELALAAASYALGHDSAVSLWPWDLKSLKLKDRRRNLVRATALLVAEIERIDRRDQSAKS